MLSAFAPLLLERKAKALEAQDQEKGAKRTYRTVYETDGSRHWRELFGRALTRPFKLFALEPIVQLLGIYMAFIYGVFYRRCPNQLHDGLELSTLPVFLTTIPTIFADIYHEGPGIAGLHYIALGIGLSISAQVNARALDYVYKHFKARNNGHGEPEFRLPSMIPGTIVLPFGLLLAGWSAQNHLHWIATDIVSNLRPCNLKYILTMSSRVLPASGLD